MTVTVKHAHVTALPNDASKDVSATAWNEAHTITGTKADFDAACSDGDFAYQSDLSSYATTAAVAASYQPLDADLTTLADLSTATGKTTPVDADYLPVGDSAASNVFKKLTWANAKATLKSYFDTLYGLLASANTWTAQNTFAAGTIATSQPLTVTQTWNAGAIPFSGLKVNITNTASAAASLVLDIQSSGTPILSFGINGIMSVYTATGWGATFVSPTVYIDSSSVRVGSAGVFGFGSGTTANGSLDTGFGRNAAGVVEVTNTVANTYRDLKLRNLLCGGGNGSYVQTPSMTVANLAAAATAGAGARAFVTDATATTFLSTVAGGGANKVPVVSDGTNWKIG